MHPVAARIAKIHFAMLNDRVGPIRNIKRSIRAKLYVNWPKRHIRAADKQRHLFRDVGGALFIDGESYHAIGAEIARDHLSLPILRELFAVDDFKAAEFWILSWTYPAEDSSRACVGHVHRARHNIVDAILASAIGREGLPILIELMPPTVNQPFHEHVQLHGVRAQI